MFNSIGAKLKIVARVLMILQFLGCIAAGVALLIQETPDILAGVSVIVGGFFLSWFEAMVLYALGVSAEDAERAAKEREALNVRLENLERKMDLYFLNNLPAPERQREDRNGR